MNAATLCKMIATHFVEVSDEKLTKTIVDMELITDVDTTHVAILWRNDCCGKCAITAKMGEQCFLRWDLV